ncbi:MAG: DNA internalization-related competence protein ComEC/Rec2 [Desulfococcaceae bacterium]
MPSKRNLPPWAPPSSGSADTFDWPSDDPSAEPPADSPEGRAHPRVFLRPLIPLVLAFAAGIVCGDALPGFRAAGWAIVLSVALFFFVRWRTGQFFRFSPLLLFAALGYLAIQPWAAPRFPKDHIVHAADGEYHRISGRLAGAPEDRFGGFRFVLTQVRVGGRPVSGRVRIGADAESPRPRAGDRVVLAGRLKRIRSFRNPGDFDYERFVAFQGLYASAWARAGTLRIQPNDQAVSPANRIARIRTRISTAISKAAPGEPGAVLRALVVGDKSGIAHDLRDRFAQAGVAHLLAISGLHIAIVGGLAYAFFRLILVWVPALVRRGWVSRAALLLALVPVLAYGLLSGGSPSTLRAAGTAVLILVALFVRRPPDPANLLALIAFLLIAFNPPALFSIGFQLSFAAVGAILLGMGGAGQRNPSDRSRREQGLWPWLRRWLIGTALVSLFAILGTLPLTMRYFNQAVFIGLIANFLFIPLIGVGAVSTGLAGAVLFLVSPAAGEFFFHIAAFLISAGLPLISIFADLPLGSFRTFTPTLLEIALYYAVLAGALVFWTTDPRDRPQLRKVAGRAALAGILLLTADAAWWVHHRFGRSELRVTALDVGQGTATLLEFPGGKTALVDGGGFYDNRIFDLGRYVVAPLLYRKRILTLDLVVLSHADADHLNGLLFVLERFRVREFWTPDLAAEGWAMNRLRDILDRRKIPAPPFSDLPRRREMGNASLEILHPPPDWSADPAFASGWGASDNNRSLVLRVALGEVSFLLPGDVEAEAEESLVAGAGNRLRSTVLLAPHHGSKTSSSPPFVRRAAPEIVVASAGYANRFGCPAPEVWERYRARECRLFRTDLNGAVEMVTDGEHFTVRAWRTPSGDTG